MNKIILFAVIVLSANFSWADFHFSKAFRQSLHPKFRQVTEMRNMLEFDTYQSVLDEAEKLVSKMPLDFESLEGLAQKITQSALAYVIEPEEFMPLLNKRLKKLSHESGCKMTWLKATKALELDTSEHADWSWQPGRQPKNKDASWRKFCLRFKNLGDLIGAAEAETGVIVNQLVYAALKKMSSERSTIYRKHNGYIWKPKYDLDHKARQMLIESEIGKKGTIKLGRLIQKVLDSEYLSESESEFTKPFFSAMSKFDDIHKNLVGYLDQLAAFYEQKEDPYMIAAFAHQRLVEIHPYTDGNGRMGRLVMNMVLIHHGLEPVLFDNDACYTQALEKGMSRYELFAEFLRSPHCYEHDDL